jgi:hypothetical protein
MTKDTHISIVDTNWVKRWPGFSSGGNRTIPGSRKPPSHVVPVKINVAIAVQNNFRILVNTMQSCERF